MSLFKAREWWATLAGEEEEYDLGCLCVANIDNNAGDGDKIIVGSFHGFLRIYNPRPVKSESGWGGFRPEDVLCEAQLGNPIIQIEAGKFISGSDSIHLAILQPRKISVYTVVGSKGQVEHGTQYALKLAYEHNLKRTAYNFCCGPFGGVKDKDFLCVQSMDGTIAVFEQESFAFSRFLPGALLPGPIRYVPRTDSFVTVSSARQLESYKYQVLAVATDVKTKEESQNIKSGKKVAHDWVLNVGESAKDMQVVMMGNAPPSILILGERNFFIVSDTGKLRYMKKLDFNPSSFCPYASVAEGTINTVITTCTKTLQVHEDITLQWAAQLPHIPIQTRVGNFRDLKGVMVTLDEEGRLHCSYLGTDPAMFTPPTVEVREIDYAEQDQEMKELQKVIKEQQSKQVVPLPTARPDDDVQLSVYVPPDLDPHSQAVEVEVEDEDPIPSITVKVQMKAKVPVNDVRLLIHTPRPLAATENLISFPCLDPGRPAEVQVTFFLRDKLLPAETRAEVSASFLSTSGAPRVVTSHIRLPLKLFIKPCLPIKNATYKITLDTNKAPVNLNDIFPDLLGENAGGPGNALGFQIYGGQVITLLASKTSQRYRLQCDEFESIWLLLNETTNRLTSYHRQRKVTDFKVTYEGALPLQEYFEVLDRHFQHRSNNDQYKTLLAERASQFRAIQRRLLTRFKDKTPAPLANLDTLLDGTYRQLLAIADAAEENMRIQRQHSACLSSATRMLNLLIKLWSDMKEEEFNILESAITPNIVDNGDQEKDEIFQGWQEMVDAAITHLLRTCLAKNTKDTTINPAPLAILKDTAKLKKHIALVCDRLGKGARLSDGQPSVESPLAKPEPMRKVKKPVVSIAPGLTEDDDKDSLSMTSGELGEAEVPLGSKFGENKSPRQRASGDLPPLNGHTKSAAKAGALPPLASDDENPYPAGSRPDGPEASAGGGGLGGGRLEGDGLGAGGKDFLKMKKQDLASQKVPDLDDLGQDEDEEDGRLVGGVDELIYGL